ncbi:YciI family protein [Ornithinibacillus contaminans]|uniref:YciI family protein n=1 Tax=Ornithinibacillus contaminans TaxID=694055 RepID=UPI00064DE75A|nr:YciI family protein [Ornithinibacillus contaminans]
MKYFAVFLPMKDQEKSTRYRAEHLAYLEEKQQEGHIFAKGRFTDGAGGLVIYKAVSLAEAEAMAVKDPYIETGARGYEIHEWEMKQ